MRKEGGRDRKHIAWKTYLITVSESSEVYIISCGQLQLQNTVVSMKVQNWVSLLTFLKQAV